MAIELRLLNEHEIHLANDFFNHIYKTTRSIENFKWEFLDGPNGKAIYVIAVDTSITPDKVVGIQCAIPLHLSSVNGHKILTAKSEDTLVDPNYRGQKIFEKMYELLFEKCREAGICFIWGFTPAKKAFERIGFEVPFHAHQALLVFKPRVAFQYLSHLNAANSLTDKIKISCLTYLSAFVQLRYKFNSSKEIEARKLHIQAKQEIIQRLSPSSTSFYLHMNENYLSWRILKNPFNNKYENYSFIKDGKEVADVLINIRGDVGYIEQLIFSEKETLRVRKSVLFKTIDLMRHKVALIRILCFDINDELRSQEMLFKDTGFIVLKRGAFFVWRSLDGKVNLNPNQLFLTRLFTQGNQ